VPSLLARSTVPALLIVLTGNVGAEPIVVLVQSYAKIDPRVLRRAEESAARVLATGGVQAHWLECSESPQVRQQCQNPSRVPYFVVQLLPAGVTRRAAPTGSLGFAVPSERGHVGSFAGVFYDRVEKLSSRGFSEPTILGHAIAHEMGHLLLGVEGHSDRGIMKAEWRPKELEQAVNGLLGFDPAQRRRIQQNLQAFSSTLDAQSVPGN